MIQPEIKLSHVKQFSEKGMLANLGIEITEIGNDYICGKMPVDDRTKQPHGLLHGGASVVLAESLGSIGANLSLNNDSKICVGLEINANHVRAVKDGFVYGKAKAIHIGGSTQIWEINITNEDQKLVCTSRITMAVINK